MKKRKLIKAVAGVFALGAVLIAADHIDAPAVEGTTSDITDFYSFESEDGNGIVFVANVQGLLSPDKTGDASFDENVLVEFNIDTDADLIEDLVIQAIPRNGKMYFFGPVAPASTGLSSMIEEGGTMGSVDITAYGQQANVSMNNGYSYFAGPRDDPFFFDLGAYTAVITGQASSFNDPGEDTFAGTNVLSIVVEVPKSALGTGESINAWVESKSKQ